LVGLAVNITAGLLAKAGSVPLIKPGLGLPVKSEKTGVIVAAGVPSPQLTLYKIGLSVY